MERNMLKFSQTPWRLGGGLVLCMTMVIMGLYFSGIVSAEGQTVVTYDDNNIPPLSYTGNWIFSNTWGWAGSKTWAVTDWFKVHADLFGYRYQYTGNSRSAVESLDKGDIILMDLIEDDGVPQDHASIIMGWGYTREPSEQEAPGEIGKWHMLRNAHCTDRNYVRWDYLLDLSVDKVWAYHVNF